MIMNLSAKPILKKILGLIYFFLAGIVIVLAFSLPASVVSEPSLSYILPLALVLVSLILLIKGYLKLTEEAEYSSVKW